MNNTNVLPNPSSGLHRIASLDVLRGIAITGTLGTNIWVFSHPWGLLGMYVTPVLPETTGVGGLAQLTLMALSQGKFLALLTLLFGVGLALQHSAAARRQRRWPGRYLWRAALLLLDGVVNYILVAEFDVLMGYAVTGAVVAWLLVTRPRTQRVAVIGSGALHLLVLTAIVVFVVSTPAQSPLPAEPSPYATSSFFELAVFRLENIVVFRVEPVLIGFLTLVMFLAGVWLYRAGAFDEEGSRLRRKLMIVGSCAVPADLLLGIGGGMPGLLVERYFIAPFVALGIIGVVAELFYRRGTAGWWARRATELGRVALSAYILQNLIAGSMFYGWGLGLAEATTVWRVPVTVLAFIVIIAIVAGFSHLWLRKFSLGPVEWLWKWCAGTGTDRRAVETGEQRSTS